MHKSWGNAIEFNEAADQMGVDVMRWLYSAHKPENDLLFGYNRGDEVRRGFLIPLWNVYSFLVTYANIDAWLPSQDGSFDPAFPEGPTPQNNDLSLLDRWILGRLNQVVAASTDSLGNSDTLTATIAVESFLDDLTNWYVRRSRRRFWKSEHDADKNTAYATLYHILVKLAKLLAPLIPFVTEAIYQNLVRSAYPQAYESVHHCAWPDFDKSVVDETLIDQMALARQLASVGLSARNSAGIKVRQPLSKAMSYVGGRRTLSDEYIDIVMDELNIKEFEFVDDASQLVTYQVFPDNKKLGPRFGALFPKVRTALEAADAGEVVAKVQAKLSIDIEINGETVTLEPDEILVQTKPVAGLITAEDKQVTVALNAEITSELRIEGLAREIVRRVQAMRKNAEFNIEDRITTHYVVEADLSEVFQSWGDYIKAETLSTELVSGDPPASAYIENHKIEGQTLTLGVIQN